MNKCNLIRDLLPLYVDGALSEDSRQFVERHLKNCSACAKEAEKLKAPVPEEKALTAIKAKKENSAAKKAEPIRRVSRKFEIRAAVIAAVSAVLCGVVVFLFSLIPGGYARREQLLEFSGWREYEGIRRSTHIETYYALPDYNSFISSLGHDHTVEGYFSNWSEPKTATPYIHGEDNTDIQIKFRHDDTFVFQQENPFTFSYGYRTETGVSEMFEGTVTFTTNTTDVSEIVTSYGTPALYEYLQEHPELCDPLEFAYFCFNYDFDSVTPWSSASEILLTNDMRKMMAEESIWGPVSPEGHFGPYDEEGFPIFTDRYIKPFERGEYRGYLLMYYSSPIAHYLQHIIFSYGGYLWDIRFEVDHANHLPFLSDSFDLTYFIDTLEFVGLD